MINAIVKIKREEKKLSQNELGKLIGVSQQHVDRYEKGYPIPLDKALILSQVLGINKWDLLPPEWQPLSIDDFCEVLTMVEVALVEKRIKISIADKVEFIKALLEIASEQPANQNEVNRSLEIFCRAKSI